MTVHMIRIVCEKPDGISVEQIRSNVRHWVDQHETVLLDEERGITYYQSPPGVDDVQERLEADFRFSLNETKSALLDQVETRLQKWVNWYILGYHGCPHDEADPRECEWGEVRPWGSPPSGVSV